MSRNKMERRIISLVMVLLLLLGMLPPVTAAAEDEDKSSSQIITSFTDLAEDISVQNVTFGTAKSELNLPDKLNAVVDDTPTEIDVSWESADYDGQTSADYVFTAKISDEYQLAEGLTLPMITIKKQAAEDETQEQTAAITIQKQDCSTSLYFKADEATEHQLMKVFLEQIAEGKMGDEYDT